jgi:hypothetical protein
VVLVTKSQRKNLLLVAQLAEQVTRSRRKNPLPAVQPVVPVTKNNFR